MHLKDATGMRTLVAALLVVVAAALVTPAIAGTATAERCAATKLGAAGRKANGLLKCHAR